MELPDLLAMPGDLMDVDECTMLVRHELTTDSEGSPLGVERQCAVLRVRVADARVIDEYQQ